MRIQSLIIICLLVQSALTKEDLVGPPYCPLNYYGDKSTTRCYGFPQKNPKETKTWVDAEKACREQGGLMAILAATPDGGKVLNFLKSEAIKQNINGVWVAANDGSSKNAFAWLDGAPLSPSGHLKFYEKYPEPHEGPSCVWLSFNSKENDIFIRNEACNKEKKHYICHMPMFIPDDEETATKKNADEPKNYKTTAASEKGETKKEAVKGKVASAGDIRSAMPDNLPGASAIVSISADKLIAARSDLIADMYGSAIMSDEQMEKLLPPELFTANLSETQIKSARAELTEITGDFFQRTRRNNATEIAKTLTAHMLEEGRSIRCIYGVNQLQRQVECLPANGIIDSCSKTVTMDGTTARECGLPGLRMLGCHTTIRGVACFCGEDLCNSSPRMSSWRHSLFVSVFTSAVLRLLL